MHAFTIDKGSGGVYMELGSQYVPGTLNNQIGQSPGPSQIDGYYCYPVSYTHLDVYKRQGEDFSYQVFRKRNCCAGAY